MVSEIDGEGGKEREKKGEGESESEGGYVNEKVRLAERVRE